MLRPSETKRVVYPAGGIDVNPAIGMGFSGQEDQVGSTLPIGRRECSVISHDHQSHKFLLDPPVAML